MYVLWDIVNLLGSLPDTVMQLHCRAVWYECLETGGMINTCIHIKGLLQPKMKIVIYPHVIPTP